MTFGMSRPLLGGILLLFPIITAFPIQKGYRDAPINAGFLESFLFFPQDRVLGQGLQRSSKESWEFRPNKTTISSPHPNGREPNKNKMESASKGFQWISQDALDFGDKISVNFPHYLYIFPANFPPHVRQRRPNFLTPWGLRATKNQPAGKRLLADPPCSGMGWTEPKFPGDRWKNRRESSHFFPTPCLLQLSEKWGIMW